MTTDPFSASVIPFEVPEQMRAFAEKGVSQARDNYAKFKDAAESHNGTVEAVFNCVSRARCICNHAVVKFVPCSRSLSTECRAVVRV